MKPIDVTHMSDEYQAAYRDGAKDALIYTTGMVNPECADCIAGMKRWRELDRMIKRGEWPKGAGE